MSKIVRTNQYRVYKQFYIYTINYINNNKSNKINHEIKIKNTDLMIEACVAVSLDRNSSPLVL